MKHAIWNDSDMLKVALYSAVIGFVVGVVVGIVVVVGGAAADPFIAIFYSI